MTFDLASGLIELVCALCNLFIGWCKHPGFAVKLGVFLFPCPVVDQGGVSFRTPTWTL